MWMGSHYWEGQGTRDVHEYYSHVGIQYSYLHMHIQWNLLGVRTWGSTHCTHSWIVSTPHSVSSYIQYVCVQDIYPS